MKLKKRKWLSLLLCFVLLLSMIPTTVLAADSVFSGGDGTEASPYEISDLATLETVRDYINEGNGKGEYFKLTDNIDMSEKYSADTGMSWTPIGDYDIQFKGTFDGDGYTITGLYINSTSLYQGLFGHIGEGGTVKNLGVDGTVSGDTYVGGVVGYNNSGTVTNCYNTGKVSGSSYSVGGVVGNVTDGGQVTNCYNTGSVSGRESVGGVVGNATSVFVYVGGQVTSCYNTGDVSGFERVGGVVGANRGTVSNCS